MMSRVMMTITGMADPDQVARAGAELKEKGMGSCSGRAAEAWQVRERHSTLD
jgi:hypothetical protein